MSKIDIKSIDIGYSIDKMKIIFRRYFGKSSLSAPHVKYHIFLLRKGITVIMEFRYIIKRPLDYLDLSTSVSYN